MKKVNINLSTGDIVVDVLGRNTGVLFSCSEKQNLQFEKSIFWEIIWAKKEIQNPHFSFYRFIEEKHLLNLINLDILKWYSIKGEVNENLERI